MKMYKTDFSRLQRKKLDCGKPAIRFESWSDNCYGSDGEYYGGGEVIAHSGESPRTFPYRRITILRGFVNRIPREIERTVSDNCKVQRSKATRVWNLQGGDLYPIWKADEIESQLNSQYQRFDGHNFIFRGNDMSPLQKIYEESCDGLFKLNFDIEECTPKAELYGCTDCNDSTKWWIYFDPQDDPNNIYDETGQYYGDMSDYVNFISGQAGVVSVQDDDAVNFGINCGGYLIEVTGYNLDLGSVYTGNVAEGNQHFWQNNLDNICVQSGCAAPTIDNVNVTVVECDIIEISVSVSIIPDGGVTSCENCKIVNKAPTWMVRAGGISVGNGFISMDVITTGSTETYSNEHIGDVSGSCVPDNDVTVGTPGGNIVRIMTDGRVLYSGNATGQDVNGNDFIKFQNLQYL